MENNTKNFLKNERVEMLDAWGKVVVSGKIVGLRDDEWERKNSWPRGRYHYHVDFDKMYRGKSFDTYVDSEDLRRLLGSDWAIYAHSE